MKQAYPARQAPSDRGSRRAVATVWMLVVLVVLTAVVGTITWQHLTARRLLDQRHKQLQAFWLARAGVELAAARLLSNPADYTGDENALLSSAQVRITIQSQLDSSTLPLIGALTAGVAGSPLGPGALIAATSLIREKSSSAQTFVVTSEARYGTDEPEVVVRSLTRRFRRVVEKDRVRLEHSGP